MKRLRHALALFLLTTACSGGHAPMNETSITPCPNSPNCVSTEATDARHRIEPFRFASTAAEAKRRLLDVLRAMPRTKIVSDEGNTIRAEFRTRIFRFVDDGIFVIDETSKTIRFRSAARVGHSDLGVNRKRMEKIRAKFGG